MKPFIVLIILLSFLKANALTLTIDDSLKVKSTHLNLFMTDRSKGMRISSTLFSSPTNQLSFEQGELQNVISLMVIGVDEQNGKYLLKITHQDGARTSAKIYCAKSYDENLSNCGYKFKNENKISTKPIVMDLHKASIISVEIF